MPSAAREELRRLLRLAVPAAGAQVANMMMGVVDTLMVGRFSTEALAAAALANAWLWSWIMIGHGLVLGMDPIVSQAHGARDGALAGRTLQRGLVLAVLLSVPVGVLWALTDVALVALGQDPSLVHEAWRYAAVQIPSLPFLFGFFALRSYLQAREIVRPALFVALAANLVNALLNWLLIFGPGGLPALGLAGAGIATALARAAQLGLLAALVWRARLHEGAWVPWSRDALRLAGLRPLLGYGLPVSVQLGLEVGGFSAATLLAGRLGATALAAHTIVLNLASLSFMLPLGVAQGAVTRVGNELGAGAPARADRAAWVAIGLGAGVMAVAAVLFVALRHVLPRLYTGDPDAIAAAAAILPVAAFFQVFDGTQVVACGVLRGMGRTRPAALINLVGYWAFALPLAWALGLHTPLGLAGVWWGLAAGLAVVACALLAWIARRGPARAPGVRAGAAAAGEIR